LEDWAQEVEVEIGPLIPSEARTKVLALLYYYRHLNSTNLRDHPMTDLVQHRIRLKPGTKPYAARSQKRYSPHQEWWMRKLILEGLDRGIYEQTMTANGRLSDWNARVVLADKFKDATHLDEPRLTFNYSRMDEELPGSYMELSARIHDYLANPQHNVYMQADIKYDYFSVGVHPDDRHIFAFSVPGLGRLVSLI
jgi:hypothetical protein